MYDLDICMNRFFSEKPKTKKCTNKMTELETPCDIKCGFKLEFSD